MIAGRGPESLRASKTEESDMADRQQGVVPHLVVDDAAAALEFYRKAFGATEGMRHPAEDGKRIMHAEITVNGGRIFVRSEEHTSELQSLMRLSYAVFCLKKKTKM